MAEESDLSRRRLLQAAGVAGVAGLAVASGSSASAAPAAAPFVPRGRLRRRPNFLIVMMDEQRHAPFYESVELKAWRLANLPAQNFLRRNSLEFTHHHVMSVACQPSRSSIFTGQYPSLHGVAQTSGAAKTSIEQDMYWLDPTTVPTLGNWFRAGGYDTYWKGKWHVSDADLYQPGSYNPLPSYNNVGGRDPRLEEIYLESERLEKYGFTGFIGPEPHGSNPLNSGSSGPGGRGRDEVYAQLGVEQLRRLRGARNPWLLVTSFVNPHDISLWGAATVAADAAGQAGSFYLQQQLAGSNVPRNLFDPIYKTSSNEDLSKKPTAQGSFVAQYPQAFQPLPNDDPYHRFYYQLQKNVDTQISKVLEAIASDRSQYRDTVIIYMSDHGEMLGAHGGMYQKWHSAYDEMIRVPFIFHNPELFSGHETSDMLTSHADLLPTMLGLAGLDEQNLARKLRETHTQVRPLVGRDLSGVILGQTDDASVSSPVYFMTDDQPFKGLNNVSIQGTQYSPVMQPNCLETVITYLPTGAGGARERWKYTRYWDNPLFWTTPNVQDVQTIVSGKVNSSGAKTATTVVKAANPTAGQIAPPADQFEMYNLERDPAELTNLYGNADFSVTQSLLSKLLGEQRTAKRLTPTEQPWADGTAQQFPYTPSGPSSVLTR
ncbi:MAG: sulfatase-like hydrolase/transferase [Actinomycetota bacterium]|nr:sulfatase-like hydrolase/transferase [Actinomycetota bacterium]